MPREVLLIQGAGEGAHVEDQALADYLQAALGADFHLSYPAFAGLEQVDWNRWQREIAQQLARWPGGIVVAHSLGGPALLKFLTQHAPSPAIDALLLVAAPYKCKDGDWGSDDFALDVDVAGRLPDLGAVFMYHSRDDEWVPFDHLARWQQKLPRAVVRRFDDRGHAFAAPPFVELVQDIRSLRRAQA